MRCRVEDVGTLILVTWFYPPIVRYEHSAAALDSLLMCICYAHEYSTARSIAPLLLLVPACIHSSSTRASPAARIVLALGVLLLLLLAAANDSTRYVLTLRYVCLPLLRSRSCSAGLHDDDVPYMASQG